MLCLFSRGTMKLESISIKRTDNLNEKWVQDIIADDPTILGLGDLIVKDKERMQPNAGRLDQGNIVRIISARKATKNESNYYQGVKL